MLCSGAMRHVRRTAPLRAALRAPTLRGLTSGLGLGATFVGAARTAPEAASCLWQPRRGAKRKAKGKRGGKQRQQRQEQGQVTEPEADADGDELEDYDAVSFVVRRQLEAGQWYSPWDLYQRST